MNRRNFVKAISCGALLTGALSSVDHVAAESRPSVPGSLGTLYGSTLCVSCQACVTRYQNINFPEHNPQGEQTWSNNGKLPPYTNNIIQMWTSGTGVSKDQEENGYTCIEKQCMHCVDPNCASVCPIPALRKNPKTGIVHYGKDVCIGCRYCMVTRPYNVSKYSYNNPFGVLCKCKLYNQKDVERLGKGGLPDYVEVCPTGVVIFGTREELMAEAKKRLALKPDGEYHYPCQTLKSGDTYLHMVPKYYPHLYGERGGGGTQTLILTDVPYGNLDLPELDDLPTGACSEHVQYTLYRDMMLSLAVLAGLIMLARRSTKNDHHDGGGNHES